MMASYTLIKMLPKYGSPGTAASQFRSHLLGSSLSINKDGFVDYVKTVATAERFWKNVPTWVFHTAYVLAAEFSVAARTR